MARLSRKFFDSLQALVRRREHSRQFRKEFQRQINRRSLRPKIETLEDRSLLAVVSWDGGAGTTLWEDAANWDNDSLPGPGDDVVIAASISPSSIFVDLQSSVSIQSLDVVGVDIFAGRSSVLKLNPGSALSVSSSVSVADGDLQVYGSTLNAADVILNTSGFLGGADSFVNSNVLNVNGTLYWSDGGLGLIGTIFTINGNYTQGPLGNFTAGVDVIAATAGLVEVTGVADLDGYFTLSSFTRDPLDVSQSFPVLQYASVVGGFQSLSWYGLTFSLDTPYTLTQGTTEVRVDGNVHVVSNASEAGVGSLRQAILDANASADPTLIGFRSTVGTISLATVLPVITQPTEINATQLNGYSGIPLISLDGSGAGANAYGIDIQGNASGSILRGLNIHSFDGPGIDLSGVENVQLTSNWIGTNSAGSVALPNSGNGIHLGPGANRTLVRSNLISASGLSNLLIESNSNAIESNIIGLDATGASAFANGGNGITITSGAKDNVIGGSHVARNIIGGHTVASAGVDIIGVGTSNNRVQGNYIGTNLDGTSAIGNTTGVFLFNAADNIIGVDGDGIGDNEEGNLISGNSTGIWLQFNSDNTVIAGNLIGLQASGSAALGNTSQGIRVFEDNLTSSLRIGTNSDGTSDQLERNVISASGVVNVYLPGTHDVTVAGNYIGTNQAGSDALGTTSYGVVISNGTTGVMLGSNGDGLRDDVERNVISGHTIIGINIDGIGTDDHIVAGNYVGIDAAGLAAIPNFIGIQIAGGAKNSLVGGSSPGSRNVVSGNTRTGIAVVDAATSGMHIAGNFIGTDFEGNDPIGNGEGVRFESAGIGNVLGVNGDGVSDSGEGNVISGNFLAGGVYIFDTPQVVVAGNIIGLDESGSFAIPNTNTGNGSQDGVTIGASDRGRIGTNTDGVSDDLERNVIAGNTQSNLILSGTNTLVAGNYIGLNKNGTASVGSGAGLLLYGEIGAQIGTDGDGIRDDLERNVIAGGISFNLGAADIVVSGNYVGTEKTGQTRLPTATGVDISSGASTGIVIGGPTAAFRNVIAAIGAYGVSVNVDQSIVQNNWIGVDSTGDTAFPNADPYSGIYIYTDDNLIADNVVSGWGRGITVVGNDNQVFGNFVGTNFDGTSILGNTALGIDIFGSDNTIGGPLSTSPNVVSGNGNGIVVSGTLALRNFITGNLVGVGLDGRTPLPNQLDGITLATGTKENTVGSLDPERRNVVSGNLGNGVVIATASSSNQIVGNLIGVDIGGTTSIANGGFGVVLQASANVVEDNTIAGNIAGGVRLSAGASTNQLLGNRIGIGALQTPVTLEGIAVSSPVGIELRGAVSNTIGTAIRPNIIGANSSVGMDFLEDSTNNLVQYNLVGVDAQGNEIGNGVGFRIDASSTSNTFTDNVVRFSAADNLLISGAGTLLRRNVTSDMGGQAIRLASSALSPGEIQITGVVGGDQPLVLGEVLAQPNTTYTIDLFSSAQTDQAERFVATTTIETDQDGLGTFSMSPGSGTLNGYVVATLSEESGSGSFSTSELSASVLATPAVILGLRSRSPEGTPITLQAFASTNPVVGYLWTVTKDGTPYEFDLRTDGTQAEGGIQFTPDDEGAYGVSLRVTLEDGSTFLLGPFAIQVLNVDPTPAFDYSPHLILAGEEITFTANNNDPGELDVLTTAWEVRQGTPTGPVVYSAPASTLPTASFTPHEGGIYYATMTVDDGDGGQRSLTREFQVSGLPSNSSIILSEEVVSEGDTVRAQVPESELNRTEQLTFDWKVTKASGVITTDYPISFPSSGVIEFIPDDEGLYTVELTISDSSGSVTVPVKVVTVGNKDPKLTLVSPLAPPAIQLPQIYSATIFDAGAADTHVITWTIHRVGQAAPLATNTGSTFSYTPQQPGFYVVSATAVDNDGGQSVSKTSFAIDANSQSMSIQLPPGPFVEGNTYNLTALVPPNVASYAWRARTANGAIESTATTSAFSFVPRQGGEYLVELTVTLVNGSTLSTSMGPITVQATGPTISSMELVSPSPIVEGSSVLVRALAVDPREPIGLSYRWELKKPGETHFLEVDAVVGAPREFQFVPSDNGLYEVMLTVRDSQGILAQQVLPLPVLNVDPTVTIDAEYLPLSDEIRFQALADDASSSDRLTLQYEWSMNGGAFSSGGSTLTVPRTGLTHVAVRIADDDGGSIESYFVLVQGSPSADIISVDSNSDYTLNGTSTSIPNTTDSILVLGLDGGDEITIAGAVTRQVVVIAGAGNDTIDASATSVGMTLDGGAGDDTILGGNGHDLLIAGPGMNHLQGGLGNNYFQGGGDDTMIGLSGNDYYEVHFSTVVLEDAGGQDVIDLEGAQLGVTFNLSQSDGTPQIVFTGSTLAITGTFETLLGSQHADNITTNTANTVIRAGVGDDTLNSNAQNVTLDGGEGDDLFQLQGASGVIASSQGNNRVFGTLSTTQTTRIALGNGNDVVDVKGTSLLNPALVSVSLGVGSNELYAEYIRGSIFAANGAEEGSVDSFGTASPSSAALVVKNSSDIDIYGGTTSSSSITIGASSDIDIYGGGNITLNDSSIARLTLTDFGAATSSAATLVVNNTSDIDIFGGVSSSLAMTATLSNSSDIDIFGSVSSASALTFNSSSDISIFGFEDGSITLNQVTTGRNVIELGLFGSAPPNSASMAVTLNASSSIDIFGNLARGDAAITLNNSSDIDIFGSTAGNNGITLNASSDIDIFGSATAGKLDITIASGSSDIDIFGSSVLGQQAIEIKNSSDIDIFGSSAPGNAVVFVQNSSNIDIFGSVSASQSTLTVQNSSDIDIFGSSSTENVTVIVSRSQAIDIYGAATNGHTNITIGQSSDIDIFGGLASGPSNITVSASSDIDIFGNAGGASTVMVKASQDLSIYGSYGDSVTLEGVERARVEGGIFGSVAQGGMQLTVTGNSSDIAIFGTELMDQLSIENSQLLRIDLGEGPDQVEVVDSTHVLALTDDGDDRFTVYSGHDMLIYLGAGNDRASILGGSWIRVIGEAGDDQFSWQGGSDIQIDGGEGDDQGYLLSGQGLRFRGDGGSETVRVFGGVGIQVNAGSDDDLLQLFGSLGGVLPAGSAYALLDGQDGDDSIETLPLLSIADRGSLSIASIEVPYLYLPNWIDAPEWLTHPALTTFPSSIALVGGAGQDRLWLEGDSRIYGIGGDGDDTMFLQRGHASEMAGGLGNDQMTIHSLGADNRIFGDQGLDQIEAFGGLRLGIFGQEGDDSIGILGGQLAYARGGDGQDAMTIEGGQNNVVSGEAGDDQLKILGGFDGVAAGGLGNDVLEFAGGERGLLLGQSGLDHLKLVTSGVAILSGGDGDDILEALGRHADLYGDDGDDTYRLMTALTTELQDTSLLRLRELIYVSSSNIESESRGSDTIDLSDFGGPASLHLGLIGLINDTITGLQSVIAGQLQLILLGSIENAIGTAFDDVLIGSAESNILEGGGGHDWLTGLEGDDSLNGGLGNDTLSGGAGNDIYVFEGQANESLGNDLIYEESSGGIDGLDFRGLSVGLGTLDLQQALSQLLAGGMLQLSLLRSAISPLPAEIEDVVGTPFDDTILGNHLDNRFELLSGQNVVDGKDGSDVYVFTGTIMGSTTLSEAPSVVGRDTLDFAGFDYPIDLDLLAIGPQSLGPMALTLPSSSSIENVVGTSFDDRILGNALANSLYGNAGRDTLDGRGGDDKLVGDLPQIVLLDFDSAYRAERGDYNYSEAERSEIMSRVAAAYASFPWRFTRSEMDALEWSQDMGRNYVRLQFSKGRGGGISGDAGEVDFRNAQRRVLSEVNINPLLPTIESILTDRYGAEFTASQYSEMVVALTTTIAAHELGHTAGLRHGDSFGPIGSGVYSETPTSSIYPPYAGPSAASETHSHIISSPASVGSTIEDATGFSFFGERESIKLAFNEHGISRRELSSSVNSHASIVSAEDLGWLAPLTVPNLAPNANYLRFGQVFDVSAMAIVGELHSQVIAGQPESEFDFYRFLGKAGEIINIELLANSMRPSRGDLFDGELRVYKADGTEIAFNDDDFEATKDATILDLLLTEDGEYFVAVGLSESPAIASLGGRYELFLSRFAVGASSPVPGDTLVSGSGNDSMIGSSADDLFLAGGATTGSFLSLDGKKGHDTLDTLGIAFTYDAVSVESIVGTLNTPPTVSVSGPSDTYTGQIVHFTFTAADVDAVDANGPFVLMIDWGDGSPVQSATIPAGNSSVVVSHLFTSVSSEGSYRVSVVALDSRGLASAAATRSLIATGWSAMPDPTDSTKTVLVIVGSQQSDLIQVRQNGNDWLRIKVRTWESDFRVRGRIDGADIDRILVFGLAGHDIIDLQGVDISAQVWAGSGNDVIQGGDRSDILWGEAGSDAMDGGKGRDILIGGSGADLLLGDKDDDILVAGLTAFDEEFSRFAPSSYLTGSRLDLEAQRVAIQAIQSEWTSNRSYAQRRNNIMGVGSGSRNNQNFFLKSDATQMIHNTVFDDGSIDHLFGQSGQDWFFAHKWKPGRCRIDIVWDNSNNETITDIDWWWE